MRGQRTVSQYRAVDLAMFAAMLTLFETIAVTAARKWFPDEPYTVSVVPAVTAIVMMRWGPWAALHAALGGVVFCLASGAKDIQHLLIYGAGNLASVGALAALRRWTPQGTAERLSKSLIFAAVVTLLQQLGRAVIAVAVGFSPVSALGFFTTDVITLLFTLMLIWIVRRLDGVFEEQRHYLLRIHRQEREERGGY